MFTPVAILAKQAADAAPDFTDASGGTVTTDGDYKIHTFTNTIGQPTFTVNAVGALDDTFEVLVVGGGGGGGARAGGGGGGGGVVYMTGSTDFIADTYTIDLGNGGAGAVDGTNGLGDNGEDTTVKQGATTIFIAKGGGGGGGFPYNAGDGIGSDGGSGGAGQSYSSVGTQGTETQTSQAGNSGAYGFGGDGAVGTSSGNIGGGGGGAGGVTPSNTPTIYQVEYNDGADGKEIDISGTPTYYAGGGGGGDDCSSRGHASAQAYRGLGGLGGGGNGESCSPNGNGSAGGANTGGGGGGGGGNFRDGYDGGSGVVVIRYRYQ